jgi:hypothetical protein
MRLEHEQDEHQITHREPTTQQRYRRQQVVLEENTQVTSRGKWKSSQQDVGKYEFSMFLDFHLLC